MKLALTLIEGFETPYGLTNLYHTVETTLGVTEVDYGYLIKAPGINRFTFGPLSLVGLNGVVITDYPAKPPLESFINLTSIERRKLVIDEVLSTDLIGQDKWINDREVLELVIHDPQTNVLSRYIRPHKLPFPYITGEAPDHHWGDDDEVEKDTMGNMWYLVERLEGHVRVSEGWHESSLYYMSILNDQLNINKSSAVGGVNMTLPVDVYIDGSKEGTIKDDTKHPHSVLSEMIRDRHTRFVTLVESK